MEKRKMKANTEKIYEDVKVCCQIVDFRIDRDIDKPVKMYTAYYPAEDDRLFGGTYEDILASFTWWAELMFQEGDFWNPDLPADADLRTVDEEEGCLYYIVPKEDGYEECWYSQVYVCIVQDAKSLEEKGEQLFYSDEPEDEYPDAEQRKAIAAYVKSRKDALHSYISDDDIDWLYAGDWHPCIELTAEVKVPLECDFFDDCYNESSTTIAMCIPYREYTVSELDDIAREFTRGYEYIGIFSIGISQYYDRVLYAGYPTDRAGCEVKREEVTLSDEGKFENLWHTDDMTYDNYDDIMRYGYGTPMWYTDCGEYGIVRG
jgi:hypothetical protein